MMGVFFFLSFLILVIAIHVQSLFYRRKKKWSKGSEKHWFSIYDVTVSFWLLTSNETCCWRDWCPLSALGVIWGIDGSIYNRECWSHNVGWSAMFDQCAWCLSWDGCDELIEQEGILFCSLLDQVSNQKDSTA